MKEYNIVLSIAGSDSSGGAGIQADIKAISACGGYAASCITALTAQNTSEVRGIFPVSPDFMRLQIAAVAEDLKINAAKTGMLFNSEIIEAVADSVRRYKIPNLVIDPVMVATSGAKLLEDDAVEALTGKLLGLADIITPNIPEAEILAGIKIETARDIENAARILVERFDTAALIKGGHGTGPEKQGNAVDFFLPEPGEKIRYFEGQYIDTPNTHGTGCTLSAAIAAYLGAGSGKIEAVAKAKKYMEKALESGAKYKIGKGRGPVNHFPKIDR